jgi:hypothetical protein
LGFPGATSLQLPNNHGRRVARGKIEAQPRKRLSLSVLS